LKINLVDVLIGVIVIVPILFSVIMGAVIYLLGPNNWNEFSTFRSKSCAVRLAMLTIACVIIGVIYLKFLR
jgi:hypothetical protein